MPKPHSPGNCHCKCTTPCTATVCVSLVGSNSCCLASPAISITVTCGSYSVTLPPSVSGATCFTGVPMGTATVTVGAPGATTGTGTVAVSVCDHTYTVTITSFSNPGSFTADSSYFSGSLTDAATVLCGTRPLWGACLPGTVTAYNSVDDQQTTYHGDFTVLNCAKTQAATPHVYDPGTTSCSVIFGVCLYCQDLGDGTVDWTLGLSWSACSAFDNRVYPLCSSYDVYSTTVPGTSTPASYTCSDIENGAAPTGYGVSQTINRPACSEGDLVFDDLHSLTEDDATFLPEPFPTVTVSSAGGVAFGIPAFPPGEGPAMAPPAPGSPDLPSAARMAANFAGAMGKVMGRAMTGRAVQVDTETAQARHEKCKACPGGWYRPEDDRCAHPQCGCFLSRTPVGSPGKVRFASESCPIGEWAAVDVPANPGCGGCKKPKAEGPA